LIHRRIELFLPSNQIGHLIGRNGHLHKSIMSETETRIHFDNVPYSISTSKQCTDFNLDLFQSSSTITATITGETVEAVENAIKALKELDRTTQVCKIFLSRCVSKLDFVLFSRTIF
jgi:rRNA processing protein Krr1/Pno1